MQVALADILSEIPLFEGHFEANIPYFCLRMEEEELKIKDGGFIKGICCRRMENGGLGIQNGGSGVVN